MRRVKDQDEEMRRVRDQGIKRTQGTGDQGTQGTKGREDQGTNGSRNLKLFFQKKYMFFQGLRFFSRKRRFFFQYHPPWHIQPAPAVNSQTPALHARDVGQHLCHQPGDGKGQVKSVASYI